MTGKIIIKPNKKKNKQLRKDGTTYYQIHKTIFNLIYIIQCVSKIQAADLLLTGLKVVFF